jgi:putative phosphoribosyl transferase
MAAGAPVDCRHDDRVGAERRVTTLGRRRGRGGEPVVFRDRRDAGRRLAQAVADATLVAPVVLALPRGGVPVAYEVARTLDAPLDVLVARKLGAPGHPEFGMGAIAEGGARVVDAATVAALGVQDQVLERIVAEEQAELDRRVHAYRGERPGLALEGRDVVLVDDGLATGVTMRAAVQAVRAHGPRRLVVAAPVGSATTVAGLTDDGVDVVCLSTPTEFTAVGQWYARFDQTSDREVLDLLAAARLAHEAIETVEGAIPPE